MAGFNRIVKLKELADFLEYDLKNSKFIPARQNDDWNIGESTYRDRLRASKFFVGPDNTYYRISIEPLFPSELPVE